MFVIAAILAFAVLILGGTADLIEAQFNADELSQMGVQKR